jgi:N-acetyl-gamma-glutamylphosphate reductase
MPRYLVERTFVDGLHIPINDAGAKAVASVVATNAEQGVTWVHSYVSDDHAKTFCVYDGPSPEAIRQVAERNGLPVDAITQVRVLDPYFYADFYADQEVAADAS